jgi:isoquinoline 1-oxidoreductase beta subunit
VHPFSGRRLSYGTLASAASKLPVPPAPPLKDPVDFRLIGKPQPRTDGAAIVHGTAVYGIDVRIPNMLVAVVARCPVLGGRLKSYDAHRALAVAGVRHVVPMTKGIATGVAVAADDTWAALKGREALRVEWDPGPHARFSSEEFLQKLRAAVHDEGYPIRHSGDPNSALAAAARRMEANYMYPFQAHAPVEPMNCVANVRAGSCEVWAPSQTPETAHTDIVAMLKLPPEAVTVYTTLVGGGFGRRLFVDYVHEAVELSASIRRPVQVLWSRADDMKYGFFHPASVERFEAGLDRAGRIVGWRHNSVGSDLSMFGLPTETEKRDRQRYARDESPWGAFDTPYNFPALDIQYLPVDSPVPSGAWRAVEYPSRVFGRECFLDEIARATGKDPIQLRLELLAPGDTVVLGEQRVDRKRMIDVLEALRIRSDWTRPLPIANGRRHGRGVAINIYHADSYIAQVAEVSVGDKGDVRVERVVCAVDCGIVINPRGLEGQVESGITWGLSAALHGKIDFVDGAAQQETFADFEVMRMDEMPVIETRIVPSDARPGGFGEHAVPPIAPAVANAVFDATGHRVRDLPIKL